MAKIIEFLTNHGFKIMLGGFGISAAGLLLYMKFRDSDPSIAQYAFAATIAGFCIYIIGRIFVFIQRRNQKKTALPNNGTKDVQ